MKLTNPTDEQLNAEFALKVAKLTFDACLILEDNGELSFTESFDAVLPWLEKCAHWKAESFHNDGFWVQVDGPEFADEWAKTLPKAAVIALLRAHDVAVEFSPAT